MTTVEDWPITQPMMAAAAVRPMQISKYLGALNAACREFDIVTPYRAAYFLATVAWESTGFQYTRELWGPTLAQAGYEGRRDLGNTQPGDGFKFRGSGLIEITGRANHAEVSAALLGDPTVLQNNPDLLSGVTLACRSAAWFWFRHGLNDVADDHDFDRVTRIVNGGTNGLPQRRLLVANISRAMGLA